MFSFALYIYIYIYIHIYILFYSVNLTYVFIFIIVQLNKKFILINKFRKHDHVDTSFYEVKYLDDPLMSLNFILFLIIVCDFFLFINMYNC